MYSNRVMLVGFLGKDAEVRHTRNQTRFTVLSLATKRSWKDRQSGEYKSQTTWHRCIGFGSAGEFAAKLTKGAHIQVEGELQTREYTPAKGEAKKSITEVRIRQFAKLDRPNGVEAQRAAA